MLQHEIDAMEDWTNEEMNGDLFRTFLRFDLLDTGETESIEATNELQEVSAARLRLFNRHNHVCNEESRGYENPRSCFNDDCFLRRNGIECRKDCSRSCCNRPTEKKQVLPQKFYVVARGNRFELAGVYDVEPGTYVMPILGVAKKMISDGKGNPIVASDPTNLRFHIEHTNFIMDLKDRSNVARFVGRGCNPNVVPVTLATSSGMRMFHVSNRYIPHGEVYRFEVPDHELEPTGPNAHLCTRDPCRLPHESNLNWEELDFFGRTCKGAESSHPTHPQNIKYLRDEEQDPDVLAKTNLGIYQGGLSSLNRRINEVQREITRKMNENFTTEEVNQVKLAKLGELLDMLDNVNAAIKRKKENAIKREIPESFVEEVPSPPPSTGEEQEPPCKTPSPKKDKPKTPKKKKQLIQPANLNYFVNDLAKTLAEDIGKSLGNVGRLNEVGHLADAGTSTSLPEDKNCNKKTKVDKKKKKKAGKPKPSSPAEEEEDTLRVTRSRARAEIAPAGDIAEIIVVRMNPPAKKRKQQKPCSDDGEKPSTSASAKALHEKEDDIRRKLRIRPTNEDTDKSGKAKKKQDPKPKQKKHTRKPGRKSKRCSSSGSGSENDSGPDSAIPIVQAIYIPKNPKKNPPLAPGEPRPEGARPGDYKKRWRCRICKLIMAKKFDMEVHARTHTGERPEVCETCGDDFPHPQALARHIETVHLKKKITSCKKGCGYFSTRADAVHRHEKKCTGDPSCNKGKLRREDLPPPEDVADNSESDDEEVPYEEDSEQD